MHFGTATLPFGKIYNFVDPLNTQNLIKITLFLPYIEKFECFNFSIQLTVEKKYKIQTYMMRVQKAYTSIDSLNRICFE
jgi:hypothetical protein